MTLTPGDDLNETSRQRTRNQFGLLREAHGTAIIVDTDDPADFNFICSSEDILLPAAAPGADPNDPDDPVNQLRQWFSERPDDYGTVPGSPVQERVGLSRRFTLPSRLRPAPDGKDLLATLAEIDADFGPGFARPNHLVHICGKGTICPATEPTETGFSGPWPPKTAADQNAGAGVSVVVIDTGYDAQENAVNAQGVRPWPWLDNAPAVDGDPEPSGLRDPASGLLRAYAGHGTFVAGVIRAMAPACTVKVLNLLVDPAVPGGGVFEAQLVDRLYDSLDFANLPHLINMSAGCPTRLNLPSRSFEDWRADLVTRGDPDLVLVAAAGNNSSPWGFWPASFDWATGVGSLDRDGQVSSFSNWGDSVDAFALGRNVVNAFPNGTYVCHEAPDRGDTRIFTNSLARWSGTSFSAPVVTGLIAAEMSQQQVQPGQQRSARTATTAVLAAASSGLPVVTARTAPVVAV